MHDLDLDLYNGPVLIVNMLIEIPYAIPVLSIVTSAVSVAVFEIFSYEIPNVRDSNL